MSLCFYFSLSICKIYIPFVLFKSCFPPQLQLAYIEMDPNGPAHFWDPSRADLAASICLYSCRVARGQVNERCRMYWAWTHGGKCPLMSARPFITVGWRQGWALPFVLLPQTHTNVEEDLPSSLVVSECFINPHRGSKVSFLPSFSFYLFSD